jgi:hypothetical protein
MENLARRPRCFDWPDSACTASSTSHWALGKVVLRPSAPRHTSETDRADESGARNMGQNKRQNAKSDADVFSWLSEPWILTHILSTGTVEFEIGVKKNLS